MKHSNAHQFFVSPLIAALFALSPPSNADVVTELNALATETVAAAELGTPVTNRIMAIVQTAVHEAVEASPEASREAAAVAANRAALTVLVPAQKEAIESAYQQAIASIEGGTARDAGIDVGEKAAAKVVERRANDGAAVVESYRPATAAGVYVPTTIPAVPQWPTRTPWMLKSPSQFRPGPPPALDSERWARDYNEVKSLGAKEGSTRTPEQTDIARFWEASLPSIYYGIVRSVADQPGRDIAQNARLFAIVAQAMDDAIIAVFDAKYFYGFWRPITAIRNGDRDRSDATERDADWSPLIETPMHPEYPCAHCIIAATVGTVLQAEIGDGPTPVLTTTSYLVEGSKRSWKATEDFIQEVSLARIYDGVHYRSSTEAGMAMGRKIGNLAVERYFGTQ